MLQDSEVALELGMVLAVSRHEDTGIDVGEEARPGNDIAKGESDVSGEDTSLSAIFVDENEPSATFQVGVGHKLAVASLRRLDFELGSEGVGEGERALSLDLLTLLGET